MGIRQCQECSGKVSSAAKACPHCGAPQKQKTSFLTWVFACLIVVLAVNWIARGVVVPKVSTASTAAAAASSSNLSPAQSAWAVRVSKAIKAVAHDPSSIEWIYAGVTDGGEVGCVEYRAKNRMGALVLERLVVNAGKFERAPAAVSYGCGAEAKGAMRDVVGVFRYYP